MGKVAFCDVGRDGRAGREIYFLPNAMTLELEEWIRRKTTYLRKARIKREDL
jgi:hypothetical protein